MKWQVPEQILTQSFPGHLASEKWLSMQLKEYNTKSSAMRIQEGYLG